MAVTAAGTPYVESSDNVADYPGVSLALANHIDATSGKVLQVVSVVKTDRFTTTSGSNVDITGYSASITPSNASNKILVMSTFNFNNSSAGAYAKLQLLRGSTEIVQGDAAGSSTRVTAGSVIGNNPAAEDLENVGFNYLDSPATTSEITYKWQVKTFSSRTFTFNGTQNTADANQQNTASTITLMEISA